MLRPLEDNAAVQLKDYFAAASGFIRRAESQGGRVLVHCVAGASRSVAYVIMHLISVHKIRLADAWTHIIKLRCAFTQRAVTHNRALWCCPSNLPITMSIAGRSYLRTRASCCSWPCSSTRPSERSPSPRRRPSTGTSTQSTSECGCIPSLLLVFVWFLCFSVLRRLMARLPRASSTRRGGGKEAADALPLGEEDDGVVDGCMYWMSM